MIGIARKVDRLLRRVQLSRAVSRGVAYDDLGWVLTQLDTLEAKTLTGQSVGQSIDELRERVREARTSLLFEARYVEHTLDATRAELEQTDLPLELVAAQANLTEELANALPTLYGGDAELISMESAQAAFTVESLRDSMRDMLKLLGDPIALEFEYEAPEPEARWPESFGELEEQLAFSSDAGFVPELDDLQVVSLDAFMDAIEGEDDLEVKWPTELESALTQINDALHVIYDLGGDSTRLDEVLDKVWDDLHDLEEALDAELTRRTGLAQIEAALAL